MKKTMIMMATALVVALSSCGEKKVMTDAKTLNGSWVVVELNGKAIQPTQEAPYMDLNFEEDRISGKAGCNNIFGAIQLSDSAASAIRFPQVATTMMACPDMELESEFLKALDNVRSVEGSKEGKVSFLNADGQTLFVVENK
ncbi:MAG: META domain-containing protein [Bacteroidales bacterium]